MEKCQSGCELFATNFSVSGRIWEAASRWRSIVLHEYKLDQGANQVASYFV
jgi:hypothetical protein